MTVEIVLLAMVAAFLGLRLYSVLGKRTGHEQEHLPKSIQRPLEERAPSMDDDRMSPLPDIIPARPAPAPMMVYEPAAEAGIRAIIAADRSFDVGRFLDGAKTAYGMILEAFWRGDRDELRALCDADTYADFDAALTAREERGETLDNRLVRIDETRIVDAQYSKPMARITLRFDADIAAVVRDKDGVVVGGSMSDAVETHDIWTFSRDLTSGDPNWLLDETDEA